MRETPYWRRYLRLLGSNPVADVEDELEFHFTMRVEDLMRRGLSDADARAQAQREFGDVSRIRNEMKEIGVRRQRRERRASAWESWGQDVRHAIRQLRKSAGFSTVAIVTLALGIGASTAMFTLVNSVLLRPLEYGDPERLVMVWEVPPDGRHNVTSPYNYTAWREQTASYTDMAATFDRPLNVTAGGEPEEMLTRITTANFFSVLDARALHGRTYVAGDDGENVTVISHQLWQRRFGSDPNVIGRTLQVGDNALTIVGVMPADFRSVGARPELWVSLQLNREWTGRYLQVVGRLRPGVQLEQAQTEIAALATRLGATGANRNPDWTATVVPLHEQVTGEVKPALLVLLGAVGLLLLIACANVANLLLGRAAVRGREMAVRLSLGATRGRLIRQTLSESLVLALIAGALGLGLAIWGTQTLVSLLPSELALPRADEVRVDGGVLGFALGVALLTGILFGIAPALLGSGIHLAGTLREATRGTTGGRSNVRRALVIGEVALAVVLLVGAGLLGRTMQRLMAIDTGVRTEQVLTMRTTLTGERYANNAARINFVNNLVQRLETVPGVRAAGTNVYLPLTGEKIGHIFWRADQPRPREGEELSTDVRVIAGDYFNAIGMRVVQGRAFEARDNENAPPVFILNEESARRYFPGENPIGKQVTLPWDTDITGEVVGIVSNVRELGPTLDASPALYRPFAQMPQAQQAIVIRTEREPLAMVEAVSAAVREIDAQQPLGRVRTLDSIAGQTVARERLNLYLLGGFAGMALLLAGLGLYGIVSYNVAQRGNEIGVRVALGARRIDVLRLIISQGMMLTMIGLLVGLGIALAASRVMSSLLFGVAATDPITLIGVAVFLTAVALLATYVPGRRAMRLDPLTALRTE